MAYQTRSSKAVVLPMKPERCLRLVGSYCFSKWVWGGGRPDPGSLSRCSVGCGSKYNLEEHKGGILEKEIWPRPIWGVWGGCGGFCGVVGGVWVLGCWVGLWLCWLGGGGGLGGVVGGGFSAGGPHSACERGLGGGTSHLNNQQGGGRVETGSKGTKKSKKSGGFILRLNHQGLAIQRKSRRQSTVRLCEL